MFGAEKKGFPCCQVKVFRLVLIFFIFSLCIRKFHNIFCNYTIIIKYKAWPVPSYR